jgi:hypothetical protein
MSWRHRAGQLIVVALSFLVVDAAPVATSSVRAPSAWCPARSFHPMPRQEAGSRLLGRRVQPRTLPDYIHDLTAASRGSDYGRPRSCGTHPDWRGRRVGQVQTAPTTPGDRGVPLDWTLDRLARCVLSRWSSLRWFSKSPGIVSLKRSSLARASSRSAIRIRREQSTSPAARAARRRQSAIAGLFVHHRPDGEARVIRRPNQSHWRPDARSPSTRLAAPRAEEAKRRSHVRRRSSRRRVAARADHRSGDAARADRRGRGSGRWRGRRAARSPRATSARSGSAAAGKRSPAGPRA